MSTTKSTSVRLSSCVSVVSLNRLSVGCGTTPRRQSGYINGFCLGSSRDGIKCCHLTDTAVIYIFINNCKCVFHLFCVNISLILNVFIISALFDQKISLFNVYAIRVGLDNAATSRILVNPAVILIL